MPSDPHRNRISSLATKTLRKLSSTTTKRPPKDLEDAEVVSRPPIDYLPVEILGDIFLAAIPDELSCARNLAILRLCWVSSLWRHTATELSSIWRSLAITLPKAPSSKRKEIQETRGFWKIVDEWIQRARDLPLSLSLAESPQCDTSNCIACDQLRTNVVHKYSSRVQLLEGITPHLFENLSSAHRFESLHSLIFDVDRHNIHLEPLVSLSSFAPNLRRISLNSSSSNTLTPANIQASTQVWSHITHLSTRTFSFTMFLDILRACPSLQGAVCYYSNDPGLQASSGDILSRPFTLPCLTTLTIVLSTGSALKLSLFRCLELPALITFRLGSFHRPDFGFDYRSQEDLNHAYQKLRNIRRLSLFFNSLSKRGVLELLLHLSDLEELDIQDCHDVDEFFADLYSTQETSSIPLLPSLHLITVDLRELPNNNLDDRNVSFFLKARLGVDAHKCYWRNLFQIKIYLSGKAAQTYRPLLRPGQKTLLKGIPIDFVIWDPTIGCRGSRWKYRLGSEEGKWVEGI